MQDALFKTMLDLARAAQSNAHAPYSHFHVGACVEDEQGRLFAGCNLENASYGLTNCAERGAIAKMVSEGGRKIRRVVVIGPGAALVTPCGACRQVIREFAAPDTPVYVCGDEGLRATFTLDQLLPSSFGPENLA